MATYKDLQDRIALDYLNNMVLGPEIKRAINNSIRSYEANHYWFNDTATDIVALASTTQISLPSNFLSFISLRRASSSYMLSQVNGINDIQVLQLGSATGEPTHFTFARSGISVFPIPNTSYSLGLSYVKSLAVLSADTDTNAWTNEAGNLIAHAATIDLLSCVLQVDDRIINRHVGMLRLAQNELATRNSTHLTFKIRATQF